MESAMKQRRGNGTTLTLWFGIVLLALAGCRTDDRDRPDPVIDLPIAALAGDQCVPHLAPLSDGDTWISWYAAADIRYQMRLQRIDRSGKKQFQTDGLLVSNHLSDSWVCDYTLLADAEDNALIFFSDIRSGRFTVHAYKISPTGAFLWGADGVELTPSTGNCLTPRAVLTADGDVTVAWEQADPEGGVSTIGLQRLSKSGTPRFSSGLTISGAANLSAAFPRLIASDANSFIVVWRLGPAGTDDHGAIMARKYAADGTPAWSGDRVVYDDHLLPYYQRPQAVNDHSGGAFIAWVALDENNLESRIQHVDTNGALTMPAAGRLLSASGDATNQIRIDLDTVPGRPEAAVAWDETDPGQTRKCSDIDLFSTDGSRQWGPGGFAVTALSETNPGTAAIGAAEKATACFFGNHPVNSAHAGPQLLVGWTAHQSGATVVTTVLSPTFSGKLHFSTTRSPLGGFWIAWCDQRSDAGDIYAAFTPDPEN